MGSMTTQDWILILGELLAAYVIYTRTHSWLWAVLAFIGADFAVNYIVMKAA